MTRQNKWLSSNEKYQRYHHIYQGKKMRSSLQEFSFQVNKALLPQLKLKEVEIDVNSCKLRI